MKTLYILRHGKSSWAEPDMDDFNRPLLPKGQRRTQRIANYIKEKKLSIDLIISSPAVRAQESAKIIASELYCDITTNKKLYPGYSSQILETLFIQSDAINSIMIVGHNPGLTSLVHDLIDSNIEWLPTSGLASVSFDTTTWIQIPMASKLSSNIVTPKMLK